MPETFREVSALEKIDDVTSELFRVKRMVAQRAQKEALDKMKVVEDFNSIGQNIQRYYNVRNKKQKWVESCKYCGTGLLTDSALPIAKCVVMQQDQQH